MEKWRGEIQIVFDGVVLSAGADGPSGPLLWTAGRQRNWGGVNPTVDTTDPPNPAQRLSTQQDNGVNADAPGSIISSKRVLMKNVKSASGADGSVVLVSSRSNIKLNKVTTYVLAINELLPGK